MVFLQHVSRRALPGVHYGVAEAAQGWDGTDPIRRLQRLPMREATAELTR